MVAGADRTTIDRIPECEARNHQKRGCTKCCCSKVGDGYVIRSFQILILLGLVCFCMHNAMSIELVGVTKSSKILMTTYWTKYCLSTAHPTWTMRCL